MFYTSVSSPQRPFPGGRAAAWTSGVLFRSMHLAAAALVIFSVYSGACAAADVEDKTEDKTEDKKTEFSTYTNVYTSMKEGLRIQTHDRHYVFKFGGRIQIDSHSYDYSSAGLWSAQEQQNRMFDVRRAQLELGVTLSEFYQAKLTAEFANKAELKDAFINLRYFPATEIRIGQFPYPFGNEGPTSSKFGEFAENSTIGAAVGSGRDRGLMLHGSTGDSRYAYQFAVMNGARENTPGTDNVDLAVRLVRNPEKSVEGEWNLWYGASYSRGDQVALKGETLTLKTESKSVQSLLKAELAENTQYSRQRLATDFTLVKGPAMLKAEYYATAYNFAANVKFQGYYVIGSYFLTGEQRTIKNGVFDRQRVKHAYDPAVAGSGAWELAMRYSVFYADRKFFETDGLYPGWLALKQTKNVNAGHTWILGVNWYPDTVARFMLDWMHTYTANELAHNLGEARSVKSTKSESTLLLRLQLDF